MKKLLFAYVGPASGLKEAISWEREHAEAEEIEIKEACDYNCGECERDICLFV